MAINLRDLEYLVAVEEERHFHRAAERCFVSQPTLSGQLKKLEERLGVQLIERSTRQVVMTDAGRAVVAQAKKVLSAAREVSEIAQSFHDPMAGELRLGLIPTVAPYLLPLIMQPVKKTFPQLTLWLHEYQTTPLLERLRNAELDFAIIALPVSGTEDFKEIDLFREPFWMALPKDDPLAQRKKASLADLKEREVMLLEEGHCMREHALDVCVTAGASEQSAFHATSLETLRHMVGEGMGITLMPELAIPKRRSGQDAVQYIPFASPAPSRRLGLLYRKGSYREATFKALAEVIRQSIHI